MQELLEKIKFNVVQGRVDKEDEGLMCDLTGEPGVRELVETAVDKDVEAKAILLDGLTAGMTEVGEKYDRGEYLIPDMLAAAEAVGTAMDILEPYLKRADVKSKGTFVIATVQGDLHDIGKNIVATMFKGAGYTVKDLGTGVSSENIVEAVLEHDAQYVGLSALLTTTMPRMKDTINMLKEAGVRDKVKVLLGGAPLSAAFAEKIGADAYCKDAFDALERLRNG
jgi:5-methyltetrahydrofolate--homocysteine methyltransferase